MSYDKVLILRKTGYDKYGLFTQANNLLVEFTRVSLEEAKRLAANYVSSWSSVEVRYE